MRQSYGKWFLWRAQRRQEARECIGNKTTELGALREISGLGSARDVGEIDVRARRNNALRVCKFVLSTAIDHFSWMAQTQLFTNGKK